VRPHDLAYRAGFEIGNYASIGAYNGTLKDTPATDPGAAAIREKLKRAGWQRGDVQRIEINEAFAAVPLAVLRQLGFPEDIVNVEGGAIAHGHAIGATGAVLATRLMHSMRRDGLKRGIVTLCIGSGQGIALALEAF
jgi:acetyl-CoA C-acetyltransferase